MLLLETPDTFPQLLKVRTLGQLLFVDVLYNNILPEDLDRENAEREKPRTDNELLLRVVSSWDIEDVPLTEDGIAELQKKRPGLVAAVIQGYFQGRVAAIEKN